MKIDDYWEPGKALLTDPAKFLESLFKYDKENIPDATILKIQSYIDSENFTPLAISKVKTEGDFHVEMLLAGYLTFLERLRVC